MTYTTNYQLPQWVKSDRIMMDDFNDANTKIDAALKSHDDSFAALEAALALKGNCTIQLSTYTGTGSHGETAPNSLTFAAVPSLVLLLSDEGRTMLFFGGISRACNDHGACTVSWAGTTVSWFARGNSNEQFNVYDAVYRVFALYLPA